MKATEKNLRNTIKRVLLESMNTNESDAIVRLIDIIKLQQTKLHELEERVNKHEQQLQELAIYGDIKK